MEKFIEAVSSPLFSYARIKSWRTSGVIRGDEDLVCYVYHNDSRSPSGVVLAATCDNIKDARKILSEYGKQ